jgi:hypothetical protein
MTFFKHVGKVNSKKVIIVQRSMADENHMACVIYSDIMPSKYHDDVMKLLESHEGQDAYEFKDILERRMMAEGTNMLQALGSEGYLKRVPAANVMVTPNSKSAMKLSELVDLLASVGGKGPDAVSRLERLENQQGFADDAKAKKTDAMIAETVSVEELTPAKTSADVPVDQNTLMMQMLQTMQAMQQQINEMAGKTAPVKKTVSKAKAKTSA